MDKKDQSYSISYKNSAGRNLIVYTFMNEEELVNYQLEMLANNRINGLLKSEVVRIDGEIHLQFDITSLVPIKKLFERRKFSRKDFLWLIKQNVDIMVIMERYLLDNNGINFDSAYIYADPQNLELGYIYLPTKNRTQRLDALKDFLLDAIINDIRFIDEPSDNFIQRLIEILKDPEFEGSSLKKYLNEVNGIKSSPINNIRFEHDLSINKANVQLSQQQKESLKNNETGRAKKLCYPAKSYIVLYIVIGTLLLFCITLILSGILSPSNPDSLLSLFGFILIGGAVIYLVYSKLFTPDKKIEKVIEVKPDRTDQYTGMEYVNKAFSIPINGRMDTFDSSNAEKEAAPTAMRNSTTASRQNGLFAAEKRISKTRQFYSDLKGNFPQDKTVILDACNMDIPYLKRMNGNSVETIIIKQFPFMMGRLEGQVDYCVNNPAIGKLHAEITKTGDDYFISDMNSRNGTMINGVRVEPVKGRIIKNGDRLTLGNEEFIFYCGDKAHH